MKKVLSVILCLVMLVGTVALGTSANFAPDTIKTYADLEETYGNFMYLGAEAKDEDGNPVSGTVVPGEKITITYYIKTSYYIGTSSSSKTLDMKTFFDNSFFELVDDSLKSERFTAFETKTGTDVISTKSTGAVGTYLYKNNTTANQGVKDASGAVVYTTDDVKGWTIIVATGISRKGQKMTKAQQDTTCFSVTLKVKDGIAAGTTGRAFAPSTFYSSYSGKSNFVSQTIGTASTGASATRKADNFINEAELTFTVGTGDNVTLTGKANDEIGTYTKEVPLGSVDITEAFNNVPNLIGYYDQDGNFVAGTLRAERDQEVQLALSTDKVTVNLDLDGGSIEGETSFETLVNTEFDPADYTDKIPVKDGYTFYYWETVTANKKVNEVKAVYFDNTATTISLKAFKLDGTEIEIANLPIDEGNEEQEGMFALPGDSDAAANPSGSIIAKYISKNYDSIAEKLGYEPYFLQYDGTYAKSFPTDGEEHSDDISYEYNNFAYKSGDNYYTAACTVYSTFGGALYLQTAYGFDIRVWSPTIEDGNPNLEQSKSEYTICKEFKSTFPAFNNSAEIYAGLTLGAENPAYKSGNEPVTLDVTSEGVVNTNVFGVDLELYDVTYVDGNGNKINVDQIKDGKARTDRLQPTQGSMTSGSTYIDVYPEFTVYAYKLSVSGLGATSENAYSLGDTVKLSDVSFKSTGTTVKTYAEFIKDTTGFAQEGYKINGLYLDSALEGENLMDSGEIEITSVIMKAAKEAKEITIYPDIEAMDYSVDFYAQNENGEYVKVATRTYKATDANGGKPTASDVSDVMDDVKAMIPEGKNLNETSIFASPESGSAYSGSASALVPGADGTRKLYFKYSLQNRYAFIKYYGTVINGYQYTYGDYVYYEGASEDIAELEQYQTPISPTKFNTISFSSVPDADYNKLDDDGNVKYSSKTLTDEEGNPIIDPLTGKALTEDDIEKPVVTDGKDNASKPYRNCEFIGWKYYYVDDVISSAANLPEEEEWIEGKGPESDENGILATVTHIAVAQWMSDEDFLFRVYADDEIKFALGKNFKRYYWNDNKPCTRSEVVINEKPQEQTLLFYKPVTETLTYTNDNGEYRYVKSYRFDAVFATNSKSLDSRFLISILNIAAPILKTFLNF